MNCIVTGAAGFIGSHLCDALLEEGHTVVGIDDLSTGRLKNVESASRSDRFSLIQKSITVIQRDDLPDEADWFFHLAGRADLVPSIENPEDYFEVNVEGSLKSLQLSRSLGIKRYLYTASSTCYGIPDTFPTPETCPENPEHPYALTKFLGEQLVMHWAKVYQLPALSLCLFNVYGPRSRTTGTYGAVFGVFLKQKLAGKPFTVVGDGRQTRDFTFVSDIAKAFIAAAESDVTSRRFNVGSGYTYSVNRLVELLQGPITHLPKRPGEPDCTFADNTEITRHLGWQPRVSLEEGVRIMLDHIEDWRDAPLWDEDSIKKATKTWFEHLDKAKDAKD